MDDKAPMQQFEQGAEMIHKALLAALPQRGVAVFHIARTVVGANLRPHDSPFIVATKDNRTESLMFTREEIMDSAHTIDPFASAKVGVLLAGRLISAAL
jgi:RNA processing factor Prp31